MPFKTNLIGIISLLLFFIVLTKVCLPQSESYLDSLDGKFALQFQISDNFNLTNFQGSTFSGKYHFSNRDAVRLGVSLEFGNADIETIVTRLDTSDINKSENNTDNFGFMINLQYIRYFTVTNSIALFGGAGPFINISNQTSDRTFNEDETEIKVKSDRDILSVGADMILGVEWWFYKQMSLSAEYGITFSYWSSKDNFSDDNTKAESKINSFSVNGKHVNFGISVYF
jgi:hypothetical protein